MSPKPLTAQQKREIGDRAIQLLEEEEEVDWIRGRWIASRAPGKARMTDAGIGPHSSIGEIRKTLSELQTTNRNICVCGEGAIAIAAAESDIPAELKLFEVTTQLDAGGAIPHYNDHETRGLPKEKARANTVEYMRELFKRARAKKGKKA